MENNFALQKQTGNFMARANSAAVGMIKVFFSFQKAVTDIRPSGWGLKFQFAKLLLKPMIMIYMINTLELVLGSFSTEVFKKIVYNIKSSEIF